MASVKIKGGDRFPVGTSVGAYLASAFTPGATSPAGSAAATASVQADGSLSFSGLLSGRPYVAFAVVNSKPAFVSFMTDGQAPVVYVPTIPGPVSDASFHNAPGDGALALDVTNLKLYARMGGAWKSTVALT